MLAKKTPFTAEEETAVITHFDHYSELDPLYLPSEPGNNPFSDLIASNDPYAFARGYAYNVAPVTDNAPFFFFTLKAGQILGEKGLRDGIDWKVNLGVLVLLLVLVISLIAVLAFLILPLALRSRNARQSPLPLLYFVAVGLGYILVEIAFIQRFVLVSRASDLRADGRDFPADALERRGQPVFAPLAAAHEASVGCRLLLVIVTLLADVFFLPGRLAAWLAWTSATACWSAAFFSSRWDSSWACHSPRACAHWLRCPPRNFPAVKDASDNSVEWAWAMNAAASVLGSVLAMVIAIQFGLTVTLACGAAAYLSRSAADARPAHESGLGRLRFLLSCCEACAVAAF